MSPSRLALGAGRPEALDHGIDLLRTAWREFDAARPMQPAVSRAALRLDDPLPRNGEGAVAALDAASMVLDQSLAQTRPRFFAYVGSSGLETAVLADAMAHSYDVNLAGESGAAYEIEQQTLRWVGEFIGYPARGGMFTSGGMVSNLSALMAARTRALPASREDGMAGTSGVLYASEESHSSVERAAEVLGLGRRGLRSVPIDAHRRMDIEALRRMIEADITQSRTPVAVVATAGTTLTGAVDPIGEIALICREFGVWLHVDGAYGLPAAATRSRQHLFDGLVMADSVSVDAHKWMFVPKACGVLLVRDQSLLTEAFQHDASYLVMHAGYRHPVESTLEYSRPFRPLKLWTAIRAHGADAFRHAIEHNLEMAEELADLVKSHPRMELLVADLDLTVVPFRRLPKSGDPNDHNHRLAELMQADGRVFVASAVVDGVACLRPCIVNFRSSTEDLHALVDIAEELGRQLERAEKEPPS